MARQRVLPVDLPAPPSVPECDRLWTIDDVATFLSVSVATIYQWRHRGDGPPCMRLGKHLRFDPAAVRAWAVSKAD